MKTSRLLLAFSAAIAALALAGCGEAKSTAAPAAKSAAAPASAAAAPVAVDPAGARAVEITANDSMKFDVTEIRAKAGEKLAVTLRNAGTMPKFSMGHNWVLLTAGADVNAFATAAASAAKTDYVPAARKADILAATKLLGPKESDTVVFTAPAQPGRYPFICSFPGHFQVGMKGELIVE